MLCHFNFCTALTWWAQAGDIFRLCHLLTSDGFAKPASQISVILNETSSEWLAITAIASRSFRSTHSPVPLLDDPKLLILILPPRAILHSVYRDYETSRSVKGASLPFDRSHACSNCRCSCSSKAETVSVVVSELWMGLDTVIVITELNPWNY